MDRPNKDGEYEARFNELSEKINKITNLLSTKSNDDVTNSLKQLEVSTHYT